MTTYSWRLQAAFPNTVTPQHPNTPIPKIEIASSVEDRGGYFYFSELVSDNRDRTDVLVDARAGGWCDGDLSTEVESHDAAGLVCTEVRSAWLEHPVE